jgi:hypothetical protein
MVDIKPRNSHRGLFKMFKMEKISLISCEYIFSLINVGNYMEHPILIQLYIVLYKKQTLFA